MLTFEEVRNDSKLKFNDISSEEHREYVFPEGSVWIDYPVALNVSKTGGHRIVDGDGKSHYIPKGWIHLNWKVKENAPHFVM